jgi:hypothetical protein
LLELYVVALAHERMLADWIKQTDKSDPRYLDVLRMHRTEAMLCGNLSGKLRLTPRSSVNRYAPKLASSMPKPWDMGERRDDDPQVRRLRGAGSKEYVTAKAYRASHGFPSRPFLTYLSLVSR